MKAVGLPVQEDSSHDTSNDLPSQMAMRKKRETGAKTTSIMIPIINTPPPHHYHHHDNHHHRHCSDCKIFCGEDQEIRTRRGSGEGVGGAAAAGSFQPIGASDEVVCWTWIKL